MPGHYDAGERIFEGAHSLVYRARRRADGTHVVLKRMRERHPSPAQLAAFAREFDITQAAAGDGVIGVYELDPEDGLVLEDFGARSLAQWMRDRRFTVTDVLQIGVQVASALAGVHRLDIVHRDVNPANIVYNEVNGVAKLIDFGIAQVLTRETAPMFEGTPRYCSPEQTGRMNRPIDHRSDLYSLGVTLYELLAGVPPFDTRDRLELVHAHIARIPTALNDLDQGIPQSLSRIVATLLQKQAEQRYQSASGLRHDLQRCLDLVVVGRGYELFPLRERDRDERLRIPQELYGREREVQALGRICADAASGSARLLFVAGYSGIGKTSLVRETRRLLAGGRARNIEGKCDQFRRDEPYAAIVESFRDLARQILAEPEDVIRGVRERVLDAVGPNGGVLIELVDDLAGVIGAQPAAEALPPVEAKNRLQLVMSAFVRAVATAERPLVLFLDDLQWADLPSFELLERIIGDPGLRHALVICAYRDNEVSPDHAIFALERAVADVQTIRLEALDESAVRKLVSDTVYAADGHERLAAACFQRTRGNAFYLNRFLESLYTDGLLRFVPERARFEWDNDAIAARSVTENVVDFLAERIERLPAAERQCMQQASAIGDRFDLDTLAAARQSTRRETLDALSGAIRAELVQPEGDGFWYVRDVDEVNTNFAWRFAHDRIRQAAHALLDASTAELVHARIGRHLLEKLDAEEHDQRVFEMVGHLMAARAILDPAERRRLEDLQLVAGRRALTSAAFDAAHKTFSAALANLEANVWHDRYERALELHLDAARAAWLCGDHDAMERLVRACVAHARTPLDRSIAREVEIDALAGRQRFADAVLMAFDVLAELGVVFPTAPTQADLGAAIGGAIGALTRLDDAAIQALPEVEDAVVAAQMRITIAVMSSCYLARPDLFPLLPCHLVTSTLAHGVTRQSPYGFVVFGIVLNVIGQIPLGYRCGGIAERMLDRWEDRAVRARTEHVLYNQVKTMVEPIRPTVDAQLGVFRTGMDTGDLEYAAWSLQCVVCNGFYAGLDLPDLGERMDRYLALMRRHQQAPAIECSEPWRQLVRNLRGEATDASRLVGADFDEEQKFAQHRTNNFRGAASIVTVCGMFARFVFRDLESALTIAERGFPFLDGAGSTYHPVWWHQYHALAWLGLNRPVEGVAANRAQLGAWCEHSSVNHQHRIDLIDAEIARIQGRSADAITLYERAIAHAKQQRFSHEEALANELAGRFYLGIGGKTAARAHLVEARWIWLRWGATAKGQALAAEFAELLGDDLSTPSPDHSDTTTTGSTSSGQLDLETLFKAANAIAGEIHLGELPKQILRVAIENAGATSGVLLLDHDGVLRVVAASSIEGQPAVGLGVALVDCPRLVSAVAGYVARVGQATLVADVRADARWQAAARAEATSVLCVPIGNIGHLGQGARPGILYLENDLVGGAFTPQRAQLLTLLASQAAISFENARLVRDLETSLEREVRLTNAHRRFIPHPFLESLGRSDISEVTLGDSVRKEMSILFADMRGFTRHVHGMSGSENIGFINTYLGYMEPPIHRAGGFVDSYVGDAIMALFDGADAAVLAAIGMQSALTRLNGTRSEPIVCGVGVNTGELTLGTIGSENRVKCGVIGDCVNVASRVESLTRHYQCSILTTDRTRARLQHPFALRFVDRVVVKGHVESVGLYEVFDGDPGPIRKAKMRMADDYEQGLASYYSRQFQKALEILTRCAAELPGDPVLAMFVERSRAHIAKPPPDEWTGVEVLLHK